MTPSDDRSGDPDSASGKTSDSAPDKTHEPGPGPHLGRGSSLTRLRNYFLAGIVVTAPIGITVALAIWVVEWIDSQIVPLIPPIYNPQTYIEPLIGFHIPGIGLITVLFGLTMIGFLTAGLVGRIVVRTGEKLLNRMPVVRTLYSSLKQIFETVLKSSSRSFREVVLIEYPRRGLWAIGFITGDTHGQVQTLTDEQVVNVFLPTTPNPTSGFLLFVPKKDLFVLDMTVEEGIKMVISAGIVTPSRDQPRKGAAGKIEAPSQPERK